MIWRGGQGPQGRIPAVFEDLRKQGYARARVDGDVHDHSTRCVSTSLKALIELVVDGSWSARQPHRSPIPSRPP